MSSNDTPYTFFRAALPHTFYSYSYPNLALLACALICLRSIPFSINPYQSFLLHTFVRFPSFPLRVTRHLFRLHQSHLSPPAFIGLLTQQYPLPRGPLGPLFISSERPTVLLYTCISIPSITPIVVQKGPKPPPAFNHRHILTPNQALNSCFSTCFKINCK